MFTLDQIVPWGRSYQEYAAMFSLQADDMIGRILGCGDGPASFNAEATGAGTMVVSCDPIYRFAQAEIKARITATYDQVLDQIRQNQDDFIWTSITSVEELGRIRMEAMERFLADYPAGLTRGRYREAELPALPFSNGEFDLALCSHLLFLYSQQLDKHFHLASLAELCRVAREVRVFPLLALGGAISPHLEESLVMLQEAGHKASVEQVNYEFQKGAHQMLRIQCHHG